MIEDAELLRRYAKDRSEAAFAELVKRRLDLVYSVALRQVGGDSHLAQDVTQQVFADLARKAKVLTGRMVISGWLYRSAQFAAADVVRSERRRRGRERENQIMNEIPTSPTDDVEWGNLRPVLDQVMGELDDEDRDAVALRFFEARSFADVGRALSLSEDAARKRVARALDKMYALLARRGVTSTTAALAVTLANQAGIAAPVGFAASVTGAALAGSATSIGTWPIISMSISKLQFSIVGLFVLAGMTIYIRQAETNSGLRREIAAREGQGAEIAALRAENQKLAGVIAEVALLRRDDAEFALIEKNAAALKKAAEERIQAANLRDNQQMVQAVIERMNREGSTLVGEYRTLMSTSKDQSLTAEVRAAAAAAAQQKLEAIKVKQGEIIFYKAGASASGTLPPQSQVKWVPYRPAQFESDSLKLSPQPADMSPSK